MVFIPYNSNKIVVTFYSKSNNRVPFDEFLDSLKNEDLQAKIYERLSLVEENSNLLKEPLSKHLEDGIFELRVKFSNLNVRILYFFFEDSIVITNGFLKKTNKTPRKEILKAKIYRKDYISNKGVHYA